MRAASVAAVAAVVFLACYLFVLVRRTEWLTRSTSIGVDVIIGFHVIGVSAILASVLLRRRPEHGSASSIFWYAFLVETAFLVMNLTGKVWHHQKGSSGSLAEASVSFLRALWE